LDTKEKNIKRKKKKNGFITLCEFDHQKVAYASLSLLFYQY